MCKVSPKCDSTFGSLILVILPRTHQSLLKILPHGLSSDSIGPVDPTNKEKGTPRVSPSCGVDPRRSPIYPCVPPLRSSCSSLSLRLSMKIGPRATSKSKLHMSMLPISNKRGKYPLVCKEVQYDEQRANYPLAWSNM